MIRTLLGCVLVVVGLQPAQRTYEDRAGRFSFAYPAAFGASSPGTDDGFGDRLVAIRFANFPATYGGEAVLTKGFPLVDLQAAGGLYDSLTLQIFPEPLRARVVAALPRLATSNLCSALAAERHVDPATPPFASLPPAQRSAIASADVMRNATPRVVECRVEGELVVFDKERAFAPGSPVQHVYGAVRFLGEPYSIFQLVAGGRAPSPAQLDTIAEIVRSFRLRSPG